MAIHREAPAVTVAAPAGSKPPRTVLVLYYARGVYPLRNTIKAHLYSWKAYLSRRTVYVNLAFGFPAGLVRRLDLDAVIFDTTFLGMRWSPDRFRQFVGKCRALRDLDCVKIALPQDEFLHARLLGEFINDFGITHVLSCANESDWPAIYPDVPREKVAFRTVLTGYVDPATLAGIKARLASNPARSIDIGYRAWRAEYWLGEHAMHKVRVAEVVGAAAAAAGLRTDISLQEKDVLAGTAWLDFLMSCRATIGVEGGATVLDADGEIKRRVDEYLSVRPGASFAQTRDACFPGEDGRISLMCISPRHLEACATCTCQLLIEGHYNGILQPWRHYVPLMRDYSNVQAAIAWLADARQVEEMVTRAHEEIACNESLTYRAFVRAVETEIIDAAGRHPAYNASRTRSLAHARLDAADRLNWAFIRLECWLLGRSNDPRRQMARRLLRRPRKRKGEF